MPISLLLCDDHILFRQGMRRILDDQDEFIVLAEADNGEKAVRLAGELQPDVVLMDVRMPVMDGVEAARRIRRLYDDIQVIMLTVSEKDVDLFAAIKAGAHGYLLKSVSSRELFDAIHRVKAGEASIEPGMAVKLLNEFAGPRTEQTRQPGETLTERETDVLKLVAQGLSNKEIAYKLSLSPHTIKAHLRHILDKLHVRSRAAAAAWAVSNGMVSPDDPTVL